LFEARNRPARASFRRITLVLGIPTLLVAAGTWFWLGGFPAPFTFISFGPFQPAFLAAVFGATLAGAAAARWKALGAARTAAGLAAAAIVLLPIMPRIKQLISVTIDGAMHLGTATGGAETATAFLRYPHEWLVQIAEYRPLFADGPAWPAHVLSLAIFAAPVALALWWSRALSKKCPLALTLALWGTFTFATTLFQRRNIYYAALLGALAGIEVAAFLATGFPRNVPVRRWVFSALLISLVLPMLLWLPTECRTLYRPGSDLLATLGWIDTSTPRRIDPYDRRFLDLRAAVPELAEAESILAPWALGHFLTYFAQRPVAADNFGYGFFDSVRFFLATDEDSALAIARARRARYVLATDLAPKMNDYGEILGRGPYFETTSTGTSPSPEYFRTMQSRLYDFDGKSLLHLKEVFASRTGIPRYGRILARWKVFEIR
jgi:hypothetical protein